MGAARKAASHAPADAGAFKRAGVAFAHHNGQPTYRAPAAALPALMAEVARRKELFLPRLAAADFAGCVAIVDPPPAARWGACECCGDRLTDDAGAPVGWRGGACELCVAARRAALRATGRLG